MVRGIVLALIYAGFTFSMIAMFWRISDRSLEAILEWGALYVFAVIAPVLWSVRLTRLMRAHGLEVTGTNLYLAWSPVFVAVTILALALPIIWDVARR